MFTPTDTKFTLNISERFLSIDGLSLHYVKFNDSYSQANENDQPFQFCSNS